MPKYTKQELKHMARKVIEGLSSHNGRERALANTVIVKTAMETGKSMARTKLAIHNLLIQGD